MENHTYDDILRLPRPVSSRRARMTNLQRAAQFAPFAALTGFDEVIGETARLTECQVDLGDEDRMELDEKLRFLSEVRPERPALTVTYFQPDPSKAGGRYVTVSGTLKKLRLFERQLLLTDGTLIPLDAVSRLDGKDFADPDQNGQGIGR